MQALAHKKIVIFVTLCDEIVNMSEHDELIHAMSQFFENDKPKVGIFWLDPADMSLFGVEKGDAEKYDNGSRLYTFPKLHKTYWQKQHHRALAKGDLNSIFYNEHDYTKIPRGKIFVRDNKFVVKVGSWIDDIDKERFEEIVQDEFNLPDDFVIETDIHWDLGHGWSEEQI